MTLSYEEADQLFRRGQLFALLKRVGPDLKRADARLRVLIAHTLAITGDVDGARVLAEIDATGSSTAPLRSWSEITLGLVSARKRDSEAAVHHFQAGIRFAQESGEIELIAWAHLHSFRFLIDTQPADVVLTNLPDVRRAVTRAGNPQTSAYLHACISVLCGQTDRLDEARRHCDIAESLLGAAPNSWLLGNLLLNRACIATLDTEFEEALEYINAAKETFSASGHARSALVCDSTRGYVELFTGDFEKARQTLVGVVDHPRTAASAVGAPLETLARVFLALGRLDDCEATLDRLGAQTPDWPSIYYFRWAVLTRARLLLRRERLQEALALLVTIDVKTIPDVAFRTVLNGLVAHAYLKLGDAKSAALRLLSAAEDTHYASREARAHFYHSTGALLGDSSKVLAQQLRQRGLRLSRQATIAAVILGIDGVPEKVPSLRHWKADRTAEGMTTEATVDAIASLFDLSARPRVFGEELADVLRRLKCASDVILHEPKQCQKVLHNFVLRIPTTGKTDFHISYSPTADPISALMLSNVLRIASGALELERLRRDEQNRAAVWASPRVEETAGAVFVAEEMLSLLVTARRIASTTVPILITGETGTGKEVLARMIHAYSTRAGATFLPFNCSGVPRDMLDSQLFGHRRGAFTGAVDNFPGVIRAAAGGTLFLDEIGETTLDVQPKLLRFLEASEVHPIGEAQPTRVDVRVIAATNADLDALVAQGRFREDLFYRLNIVRLHVPPLRERRVEIPALANHYLQKHAREYRKGDLRLAEETMEYLVLYRWPGNVRQLANEMRRMAALAETGAVLMPEHLSPEIAASRRTIPASERTLDPKELVVRIDQPMAAATQHLERTMIQYALQQCGGRLEDTAALLGLSRKGLYLKRVRYGLEPPEASAAEVA